MYTLLCVPICHAPFTPHQARYFGSVGQGLHKQGPDPLLSLSRLSLSTLQGVGQGRHNHGGGVATAKPMVERGSKPRAHQQSAMRALALHAWQCRAHSLYPLRGAFGFGAAVSAGAQRCTAPGMCGDERLVRRGRRVGYAPAAAGPAPGSSGDAATNCRAFREGELVEGGMCCQLAEEGGVGKCCELRPDDRGTGAACARCSTSSAFVDARCSRSF